MNIPENILLLYKRFLQKECTPNELQQLFAYFGTANEISLRQLIQQELKAGDEILLDESSDRQEHLTRLYQQVSDKINPPKTQTPVFKLPILRTFAALAAMLILVMGYFLYNRSQPAEMKMVYATYGKMKQIQLPDRSTVWMNAGTTIQYPVSFDGDTRTIQLTDGQAYFDVVHDASKPFIVKANGAEVTVFGTSFEVQAYEKEKEASITVSTGKVGVQLPDKKEKALFLLPGERAVVSKASSRIQKTFVALSDIAIWREQKLIFENHPLAEVMQSLERKYNVRIDIQNPKLQSEKVTMRLNNEPLENVLTALSFSNHFTYKKTGDKIVID